MEITASGVSFNLMSVYYVLDGEKKFLTPLELGFILTRFASYVGYKAVAMTAEELREAGMEKAVEMVKEREVDS